MNYTEHKIQVEHLQRLAQIYVRQSDKMQVLEHQESTRRQYDLENRARQLGWSAERIVIIDTDLAHSAFDPRVVRNGFEQILAEVALGKVGAVFSVEVSRLARQDSEWHRLVEVAALTGTVLIDEQQVYDPRLPDDRLILGVKGLLSSSELRQMGLRLWDNKLRKARRGELRINLPVGLLFDQQQGIRLDPDEQVQEAVRLLFERFRLSGRISHVVRYFREHNLQFPKRKGGWDGPLQWGQLTCQRVRAVLLNPLYAGAYVYGRTTRRATAKPRERLHQHTVHLSPPQWEVALWDAFESYLSRAEYEANLARLEQNRPKQPGSGRRQDGAALLSGIVLCGCCGKPMHVAYSGANGQHITYVCCHRQRRYAEPVCQRIPGRGVDIVVAQALLAALTPAQVDLTLATLAEMERQQASLRQQWTLRLEGARYATRLAQRRYELVDPDNRLVARTLEQEWETKLREVELLQTQFARQQAHSALSLDQAQRQQVANLVQDLPKVWHAQTTPPAERKQLLQLLVADVTLTRQKTEVLIQIRWHTNQVDTLNATLPVRGAPPVPETVVERIRTLSPTHTDAQIAQTLNQEEAHTAQGKPFTTQRVQGLRRRFSISKRST
jgi:DNA invertase Pin-like site-specific DNA recombinase